MRKYRERLLQNPEITCHLPSLRGKVLGCWYGVRGWFSFYSWQEEALARDDLSSSSSPVTCSRCAPDTIMTCVGDAPFVLFLAVVTIELHWIFLGRRSTARFAQGGPPHDMEEVYHVSECWFFHFERIFRRCAPDACHGHVIIDLYREQVLGEEPRTEGSRGTIKEPLSSCNTTSTDVGTHAHVRRCRVTSSSEEPISEPSCA